jgi:hypothetical protein
MAALTRAQKRALAAALREAAGDLVEGAERPAVLPPGIAPEDAARQIATWLRHLPVDGETDGLA